MNLQKADRRRNKPAAITVGAAPRVPVCVAVARATADSGTRAGVEGVAEVDPDSKLTGRRRHHRHWARARSVPNGTLAWSG
jgi:hypothetical protein